MKAVIMAGGRGTRLAPVTGETPKPLARLLGRPVIEHIILLLANHGIRDIRVTLGYMPEKIVSALGDGSRLGVSLSYHTEKTALGTAGGVAACRDFLGEDDFLVISGDAACDFDLSRLLRFHKAAAADVTMALYQAPEPTGYGLVLTDKARRVTGFIEKPSWERVVTDMVNTGIYVVSPRVCALIPENRPFDFAKELFPAMLQRGMRLFALPMEGYWCDIGTPRAYYSCCLDALDGKLRLWSPWGGNPPPAAPREVLPEREKMPHVCEYPCANRAGLMRAMSEYAAEFGADFYDGISLKAGGGRIHIAPSGRRGSIIIEGDAQSDIRRFADIARRLDGAGK